MECEEARFGLYALLDNELDIATNLEVLSHLEGCLSCQRELELDARLKTLVHEQLSTPVLPPELWGKVMQRIERATEGERPLWPVFGRRWPRARLFQAAAAAVMIVFALALLFMAHRYRDACISVGRRAQASSFGGMEACSMPSSGS